MNETRLAGLLEAYGIFWDETKAKELEKFYLEEMITSLSELIQYLDLTDEQKMTALGLGKEYTAEALDLLKKIFNPISNDKKSQIHFWNNYINESIKGLLAFVYWEKEINQSEHLDEDEIIPMFIKGDFQKTYKILKELESNYDKNKLWKKKKAVEKILSSTYSSVYDFLSGFSLGRNKQSCY